MIDQIWPTYTKELKEESCYLHNGNDGFWYAFGVSAFIAHTIFPYAESFKMAISNESGDRGVVVACSKLKIGHCTERKKLKLHPKNFSPLHYNNWYDSLVEK